MDFWSRIQSKSSGVKTQYAFLVAGLVTGIIGVVWVSTLPARFSQMTASSETSLEDSEDSLGFDDLINDTKSQLGSIIDTTKEGLEENVQPTTNLDSLGAPSVSEEEVSESGIPASTSTEPVAIIEPVATTTETQEESKAPRMILIGTTTSQKVE